MKNIRNYDAPKYSGSEYTWTADFQLQRKEELVKSFPAAGPRLRRDVHFLEKQIGQDIRGAHRPARMPRSGRRDHAHDIPPHLRSDLLKGIIHNVEEVCRIQLTKIRNIFYNSNGELFP